MPCGQSMISQVAAIAARRKRQLSRHMSWTGSRCGLKERITDQDWWSMRPAHFAVPEPSRGGTASLRMTARLQHFAAFSEFSMQKRRAKVQRGCIRIRSAQCETLHRQQADI
jgi:hypothetical protein